MEGSTVIGFSPTKEERTAAEPVVVEVMRSVPEGVPEDEGGEDVVVTLLAVPPVYPVQPPLLPTNEGLVAWLVAPIVVEITLTPVGGLATVKELTGEEGGAVMVVTTGVVCAVTVNE